MIFVVMVLNDVFNLDLLSFVISVFFGKYRSVCSYECSVCVYNVFMRYIWIYICVCVFKIYD